MTIKQLKRSTWIKIGVAAAVVILLGLSPLYADYENVPEEIVPEQIAEYVRTHFPGVMVKEIAKERKEYEVELSNSLELKFDRKAFFLTDYDD